MLTHHTIIACHLLIHTQMMGKGSLIDPTPIRRFLFEETQHQIGGFGKYPGSAPGKLLIFLSSYQSYFLLYRSNQSHHKDIYHSYLGLAFLAIQKEPGLKSFDAPLCVSAEQRRKIIMLRRTALSPIRTYWRHGVSHYIRENHPDFERRMRESEEPPEYYR